MFLMPLYLGTKPALKAGLYRNLPILGLSLVLTLVTYNTSLANTNPAPLDTQPTAKLYQQERKDYQQALIHLENGDRRAFKKLYKALSNYPLHHYLEYKALQKDLPVLPKNRIDTFFKDHANSIPSQALKPQWLNTLAKNEEWSLYLKYYQSSNNIKRRCWYIQALHETDEQERALSNTDSLWLTGSSLPKSCDMIIKAWEKAGRLTQDLIWRRMEFAVEANNLSLARFLIQQLEGEKQQEATWLANLHRYPEKLLSRPKISKQSKTLAIVISHALQQLSNKDAAIATKEWLYYRNKVAFTAAQDKKTKRYIAANIIVDSDEDALDWLLTYDANGDDIYLLEWRIRLAIKTHRWKNVQGWIALLPDSVAAQSRWRYWQARSIEKLAEVNSQHIAETIYSDLSKERHYYGFLASERLRSNYSLNDQPQQAELNQVQEVSQNTYIQSALELHHHDEFSFARQEWKRGIRGFDKIKLAAAVNLAEQENWHNQAIRTAVAAGHWNDLATRFPLAFDEHFSNSAEKYKLNKPWLYALALQESAFASDARSRANARGVLQLLPSTAKELAKAKGNNLSPKDLYDPKTNVNLAGTYLYQLLDRFDGNHIIATAAYNAGPNRIGRLLEKQTQTISTDIWVETIPYKETRKYVQSVLAYKIIYDYRLGERGDLYGTQQEIASPQDDSALF